MIGALADFRAFHTSRGNPGPAAASDADATAALVRGSDMVRRSFTLAVHETDTRVIDAAYVAGGFEVAADGTLAGYPGFWVSPETGKVLTKAGEIEWTLKTGTPVTDADTPRDVVRAVLGDAVGYTGGPLVA